MRKSFDLILTHRRRRVAVQLLKEICCTGLQGYTTTPDYLNESDELISLTEKHGISTDASISVHINNICERNYVQEVRQNSQKWRKRAIILIYLVQICLKPKQKPINSSMNLKELSKPWRKLSAVVPLPSVSRILIVLNVSHNNFSDLVPNTPFFQKLPLSVLSSNPSLCFPNTGCSAADYNKSRRRSAAKIAMVDSLCAACILLLSALYIIVAGRRRRVMKFADCSSAKDEDVTLTPPWEVMMYQKLDLSINDVTKSLTPSNIIGHGRTGVVYKSTLPSNATIEEMIFDLEERGCEVVEEMIFDELQS
ncbi:hypothetical protein QQ045_026957 [Rhodiola kirilowii]